MDTEKKIITMDLSNKFVMDNWMPSGWNTKEAPFEPGDGAEGTYFGAGGTVAEFFEEYERWIREAMDDVGILVDTWQGGCTAYKRVWPYSSETYMKLEYPWDEDERVYYRDCDERDYESFEGDEVDEYDGCEANEMFNFETKFKDDEVVYLAELGSWYADFIVKDDEYPYYYKVLITDDPVEAARVEALEY